MYGPFEHVIPLSQTTAMHMRLWFLYINLHHREKFGTMVAMNSGFTNFQEFYKIPDTAVPDMIEWLEQHCHGTYHCNISFMQFDEIMANVGNETISFQHMDHALMFKLTWL